MSKWLNNKHIQDGKNNGEWNAFYQWLQQDNKPCHGCGYCPYGKLVEEFPTQDKQGNYSCKVFGHHCPAFYQSEPVAEVKHKGQWVGMIYGAKEKR